MAEVYESALDAVLGSNPYPRTSRYHQAEIVSFDVENDALGRNDAGRSELLFQLRGVLPFRP